MLVLFGLGGLAGARGRVLATERVRDVLQKLDPLDSSGPRTNPRLARATRGVRRASVASSARVVFLTLISLVLATGARAEGTTPALPPWLKTFAAARAIGFDFDAEEGDGFSEPRCPKGRARDGSCGGGERSLKPAQLARLRSILGGAALLTAHGSMCIFNPHHAFELRDARGAPLGRVSVCFECDEVAIFDEKGAEIVSPTGASPGVLSRMARLFSEVGLGRRLGSFGGRAGKRSRSADHDAQLSTPVF